MPGSSEPGVPRDNLEVIVIAVTGRDSTGRGGRVRYDTLAVNSVMVEEAPATAAPATESGSGVVSPPPWAASATRSWGPRLQSLETSASCPSLAPYSIRARVKKPGQ
jgi:hypothetical protein